MKIMLMLKNILNKVLVLVKKPGAWKVITAVVVAIVLILIYWSISNSLANEKVARANDLKKQNEEVQQILAKQRSDMEVKYTKDIAQANQQLQDLENRIRSVAADRANLATRLVKLEGNVALIEQGRKDIENKVYTETDLDSKFRLLLTRGRS
jgi:septal ring factor EnvC (AmiA/AmiB activator)